MMKREAIALLLEEGFTPKGGGKHEQYEKSGIKVGIPRHAGELSRTVVASIRRAIEMAKGK